MLPYLHVSLSAASLHRYNSDAEKALTEYKHSYLVHIIESVMSI